MKVFIGHSFSEALDESFYEFVSQVYQSVYEANHEIIVGGLLVKLKDRYKAWADRLTCYTLGKYQDSLQYAKNCQYKIEKNVLNRTNEIIAQADMVIFLPGGSGTLEEIFATLETYKSEEQAKKIYLLDNGEYFALLMEYLKKLEEQKFNKKSDLEYIQCITFQELKNILKEGV